MKGISAVGWGALALAGLMLYEGARAATEAAENLRFYATGLPTLKVSGGAVRLAVRVTLNNHTRHVIPVDHLFITVERWAEGGWSLLASSQPNLRDIRINPYEGKRLEIELQTGLVQGLLDAAQLLANWGRNRVRVTTKTTVSGITFPVVQEFPSP